ncbi:MAG: hypothetical protein LUD14_04920 [Clostridiales bacterium]|nr:hypothetical protein [Clostridiales bacterium]
MITRTERIPVTKDSYPFASAERLCGLSARGYCEKEYYMYGTANVYRSVNETGEVEIVTSDAPYVNRFIVRGPEKPENCSGNVVVEIINPTAFMEIDRMWILGHEQFIRNGDIYIGITSKPNTIPKLQEFNPQRYGKLDWSNPMPEKPFPFDPEELIREKGVLPDLNISYETGLFWDMLTDLAWLLRSEDEKNPLLGFPRDYLYLTGWSQSGCYLLRYLNSFAYRPEVARGGAVFDGYLTEGAVRNVVTPVNQYEAGTACSYRLYRVEKVREPYIAVQTESENGRYGAWQTMRADSDAPDFRYRLYEVTGVSHDSVYSLVRYYQNDPDMERTHCLPSYSGLEPEGNDYPSEILFAAAFRNLFTWVRTGVGPNHCDRIPTDSEGENRKDAFGNTRGGLRTCLLNYPTGRYNSTSTIPKGSNLLDPESDKNGLFGYQEGFSAGMLAELYGSLEHYRELVTQDTQEQVSRGFVCREDAQRLVEIAVALAKKRGLE